VEDTQHEMTDIPRLSPKTGIIITEALFPGVVYLAKLGNERLDTLLDVPAGSELLIKIIYSGLAKERYGGDVHTWLSGNDMAPHYYTTFNTTAPSLPSNMVHLEDYHVMEYLPPPSNTSMGWITLHDLGRRFPQEASQCKQLISDALDNIIKTLQLRNFVHGDFRTNNVLVYVQTNENSSGQPPVVIQLRPGAQSLAYLKVVDFDWAGVANKVRYPSIRNPEIWWPGGNGKTIRPSHDKEMINHWLVFWPRDPQPVQVPEDLGVIDQGRK
jgi:hypothetical protein